MPPPPHHILPHPLRTGTGRSGPPPDTSSGRSRACTSMVPGELERLGWRQRGARPGFWESLGIYSRLPALIPSSFFTKVPRRRDSGNNLTQQVSSLAKRSSGGGALPGNPSLKQSDFLTGVKCDIPGWENTAGTFLRRWSRHVLTEQRG